MNTPYDKTFDELLNEILTDYSNQQDESGTPIDISQGGLAFIKSSCIASAMWGIYQAQNFIADQIFPDDANTANLEHHAYVRGLTRKYGETDAALLARLLEYIRRPPAGGNRYDYVKWAKEITGVASAICIPTGQGPGTVDVVVLADTAATGSEVPTSALLEEVYAYIIDQHPAASLLTRVLPPTVVTQDVTMALAIPGVNPATIAQSVTSYMNSLELGQSLYLSQLIALALGTSYGNVTISVPSADVILTEYQLVRPGVINVS